MSEIFASPLFGLALTIIAYIIAVNIQKKTGFVLCNPLLISVIICIGVLLIFDIPYEDYNKGASIVNMMLAPATACLAVSIYTKIQILKENAVPIIVGCTVGSLTAMSSILLMCKMFAVDQAITVSLLPKSVTTAIAVSISESNGGIASVTVVAVFITGLTGCIGAPYFIKLFGIKNPVEAGIAIGTASHALGTSKAIEIGETEGAMSGLAICISGIVTVIFSLFLL